MAKFYFIRHGQTEWNSQRLKQGWSDSDLTELGIEQTRQIATQLPRGTKLLFASDLDRAQHSAALIAEQLDGPRIITDWRLRERAYGEIEGEPIDSPEIDASFADESASYRGAEPVANMTERLKSFLRDCALFDSEYFVVVTHNGTLNRLNHLLTDTDVRVRHDNSSILEFDIDVTDPRLAPRPVTPWSPQTVGGK